MLKHTLMQCGIGKREVTNTYYFRMFTPVSLAHSSLQMFSKMVLHIIFTSVREVPVKSKMKLRC